MYYTGPASPTLQRSVANAMTLENRGGRPYYYRSVRDGEKVRKVYEGSGELARIAHERAIMNRAALEHGPVARCLVPVKGAPRCTLFLLSAGVVGSQARLPQFLFLVWVYLPRPGAALDHGVQFLLDHLAPSYVHA